MSTYINNKIITDLIESKAKSLMLPKSWILAVAVPDVILSLFYFVTQWQQISVKADITARYSYTCASKFFPVCAGKYILQHVSSVSLHLAEVMVFGEKFIWLVLEPAFGIVFHQSLILKENFSWRMVYFYWDERQNHTVSLWFQSDALRIFLSSSSCSQPS